MAIDINIHRAVGPVKMIRRAMTRIDGSTLHTISLSINTETKEIDTETNVTYEIAIYSDEPLTLENSDA